MQKCFHSKKSKHIAAIKLNVCVCGTKKDYKFIISIYIFLFLIKNNYFYLMQAQMLKIEKKLRKRNRVPPSNSTHYYICTYAEIFQNFAAKICNKISLKNNFC